MSVRHRPAVLPVAAVAMVLAVTGCSAFTEAVDIAPPSPSGRAARACAALHEALPKEVDGLAARSTEPVSRFTAAWGDPAVTLRCGGPKPEVLTPGSEQYNPTSPSVEVNGVQWLPEDREDDFRLTTVNRVANVEVVVPHDHAPETDVLVDLAKAVAGAVPSTL